MSELALLTGVRDYLRFALSLEDNQCQVEIDEQAPATAGNTYLTVHASTSSPGPFNSTNTNILDEIYGVSVTVALRAVRLPRDRSRNFVLDNMSGLTALVTRVIRAVNNNYALMATVNTLAGDGAKFITPLSQPSKGQIRTVGSEYFGDMSGEERGGLVRTITFNGARLITEYGPFVQFSDGTDIELSDGSPLEIG